MDDATPPPESICASPTPPPESVYTTPTPASVRKSPTAYYYKCKGRRRYPNTSSLTPYKPLPEGWDKSKHYWLYGWPKSDRQLQSLLPNYFHMSIAGTTPREEYADARYVERLLQTLTGYTHLNWFIGKPTEKTIEEGIVEDFSPGRPGVPVVTLSCTARRSFFMQRPTVKQMDRLTSILGDPQWFESQHLKKKFPLDCFA